VEHAIAMPENHSLFILHTTLPCGITVKILDSIHTAGQSSWNDAWSMNAAQKSASKRFLSRVQQCLPSTLVSLHHPQTLGFTELHEITEQRDMYKIYHAASVMTSSAWADWSM
jgi:hypothetical protein